MKERGIIFTGESVRAILEGRKTQTRRLIRPEWWRCLDPEDDGDRAAAVLQCPRGAIGDRLWVREAWAAADAMAFGGGYDCDPPRCIAYMSDETALIFDTPDRVARLADTTGWNWKHSALRWRSPIYMPRWASRLTLEIVEVRAQRLQEITEEDARAEGLPIPGPVRTRLNVTYPDGSEESTVVDAYEFTARGAFCHLWDGLHGRRAPWSSNPWVWALTFRRI